MPSDDKPKRRSQVDKPDDTLRATDIFSASAGTGFRPSGPTTIGGSSNVSGGGNAPTADDDFDLGDISSDTDTDDSDAKPSAKLPGSGTDTTVIADFREGYPQTFQLPPNVDLLNTDHAQLEECEDGGMALALPDGAFLRLKLPKPVFRGWGGLGGLGGWGALGGGWPQMGKAKDDGFVRTYSIMLCVRVEELPKLPLPIFHGGMPQPGESLEFCSMYKNGGVGALGSMGTQAAAVRAERWAWVTITRKDDTLRTYVNAIPCATVSLKPDAEGGKDEHGKPTRKPGKKKLPEGEEEEDEEEDHHEQSKGKEAKQTKEAKPREKFLLDRNGVAFFAELLSEEQAAAREGGAERGLSVRYLSVVTGQCWDEETIRQRLHALRVRDEEDEVTEAVLLARQKQLTLKALYEKPPPIWMHPGFAAEFGDAFIGGTPLAHGALHVSLEVLLLALKRMQAADGVAAGLPHTTLAALNATTYALDDCLSLALKLRRASGGNAVHLFLRPVVTALANLPPGELMLIPLVIRNIPRLLVVRRAAAPNEAKCVLTICCSGPGGLSYNRNVAEPPKIRYQTSLEVRDVDFGRVCDEALWVGAWYASTKSGKRDGEDVLHTVLLPYLTGMSLEHSMLATSAACKASNLPDAPMRSARRTRPDYGGCRTAAHYLLTRVHGVPTDDAKHVSLLLRLQMLKFARNDLPFVGALGEADRTVLNLASRQLAYKAARLAERFPSFGLGAIASVRGELESLKAAVARVPGSGVTPPPPPLLLSKHEQLLFRESLASLLGHARLLAPSGSPELVPMGQALEGVQVLGLYFSASWCPPCRKFTPQLASAYSRLRGKQHGFELFLCGLDQKETAFDSYRAHMPWPALPFGSPVVTKLAERFGVDGIPKLILLTAEGELVSDDGVRLLRKHALAFPWTTAKPVETPHMHMLCERLLRLEDVDAGPKQELPMYKEIDMLALPSSVQTRKEAVAAVRHCDWLCTALAVQSHSVHNTSFLKFALVEFVFTQLLPIPVPARGRGVETCVWRAPMVYEEQRTLLEVLARVLEHFAAAALSLNHTRSADAVRMVVPACIAAIADCVFRQKAITNYPSELCTHLGGVADGDDAHKGFTLDCGALAAQAAFVACHTPETNLARCAVLDYFASMRRLPKLFRWDKSSKFPIELARWLRCVCSERAFPADAHNLVSYVTDHNALLIKNYPEFKHYRDIAFYFKFFLNPDKSCFPSRDRPFTQREMQLTFSWNDEQNEFRVAYCESEKALSALPKRKRGENPPKERFSSLAVAAEYVKPQSADNEDDVLHMWELPSFGELDVANVRALGQHDSELLLSYLTVPYLRIPLVVSFFATDDRIHSLQSPTLQHLFDAALFEPGHHLPLKAAGVEPVDVPTSAPELLGTAHHLLLNELCRSPDTLLGSITKLMKQAVDLDTGTLKSSTATIILFMTRLACRVDNYVQMVPKAVLDRADAFDCPLTGAGCTPSPPNAPPNLPSLRPTPRVSRASRLWQVLDCDAGVHETLATHVAERPVELGATQRARLIEARAALKAFLWQNVTKVLRRWHLKLVKECTSQPADETTLDRNTKYICNLEAHALLCVRNCSLDEFDEQKATVVTRGVIFLSTRHQWNRMLLDAKGSGGTWDGWRVPETELYETVQVLRRRLVTWLRAAPQSALDVVMDAVLRASAANGALLPTTDEVAHQWAKLLGHSNRGRFTQYATRSRSAAAAMAATAAEVAADSIEVNVVVDVQVMQLTLKASHPQALPEHIAKMGDVGLLFGRISMQASLVERCVHRETYQLVGRAHALGYWPSGESRMPKLESARSYYAQELFPSEKKWLPAIFQPFYNTYAPAAKCAS